MKFTFIRQSPNKLRLWLIAAAGILLLTSILEAGHIHGAFTATEDNCTLCQHTVALDKVLGATTLLIIPLLLAACVAICIESLVSFTNLHPAHIRAPPYQLHTH